MQHPHTLSRRKLWGCCIYGIFEYTNAMGIIQQASQAIAKRDFGTLDDLWTEMVLDERTDLENFLEIAKKLKKCNESERALNLLEMLASHLETNKEFKKTLEVYKNMLYYTQYDTEIRKKIINLYRLLHKESEHMEEYIEISGISRAEPIFKSIGRLEELLKYDIDQCFFFERYGMGRVVDTIPSKNEIVIDFEKKKRHFLTLDVARGLLTPINKGHFLYIKHNNIDELKRIASDDLCEIVKLILVSFQEPLSASQIKSYLDGIVERQKIAKSWEKIRKKLEKDKHIKIAGRTTKTYTYIASDFDKIEMELTSFKKASDKEKYLLAEEYVKKTPTIFEKILPELIKTGNKIHRKMPALALDILMLCDDVKTEFTYTLDTILEMESPEVIIKKSNNLEHQKRLLQIIKDKNPAQWGDIFKNLIFDVNNHNLLNEIAEELKSIPHKLKDVYYTTFSVPKQYPQQFQWMLKKIQSGDLQEYLNPSFLPKFFDSLDYIKGIKGTINKILTLENFDRILQTARDVDAKHILEAITSSMGLEDYKKKDFLRIIKYHFPHLFTEEVDIIYATEAALYRKKEELNRITEIEIPENKKEISRAREFGDLSENFEYKAAREKQAQLYEKARIIGSELQKAQIIDPAKINTDKVNIGTKIILKNLQNGASICYTVLGRWDTNLQQNIISNEAPVGQSLLGRIRGDHITIDDVEYEITEIQKGVW